MLRGIQLVISYFKSWEINVQPIFLCKINENERYKSKGSPIWKFLDVKESALMLIENYFGTLKQGQQEAEMKRWDKGCQKNKCWALQPWFKHKLTKWLVDLEKDKNFRDMCLSQVMFLSIIQIYAYCHTQVANPRHASQRQDPLTNQSLLMCWKPNIQRSGNPKK